MLTKQTILVISLCAGLLFACPVWAKSGKHTIHQLQESIAQQKQKHLAMQKAFKKADEQVNHLNHQLKKTDKKLKQQHASLKDLDTQQQTLSQQLKTQQTILAKAIVQAYKIRKNPTIQMIINDQNPEKASRMLHYYASLNDKHIQSITALQLTLANLQSTAQQMKHYQEALRQSLVDQRQQKKSLSKTRAQKTSILKKLEASIHSNQQALNQLKKDKQDLDIVVKQLNRPKKKTTKHFGKHSLPWPTHGKIVQHFGTTIKKSELRTHGIVIKSHEGDPVFAVANGKVIFAKWMSGFGLLMIVEHDNGFLSLYGRNDSLDAEVNDHVKAGDQIASVGHSGAFSQSGLYFAIRQGDKPVDPEKLLAKSG